METSKAIVPSPSSPSETLHLPQSESQLSSLVYGVSHQVQVGMEDMLKMISETDQSSAEIFEEIGKCKESEIKRKKFLEEEREHVQKAAFSVLELLNANEAE